MVASSLHLSDGKQLDLLPRHQEHNIEPQTLNARSLSISVVFPAFNDAGTIGSMVLSARRAARKIAGDYEIIVVNDGSGDHTSEVLEELEEVVPELRVIHHSVNGGYGAALKTGFQAARKDLVFYTDGDAQFDPQELVGLREAFLSETDYVNGYRLRRADPFLRVLIGNPYHRFVRFAFGLKLRDIDCDFRLFRRTVLQRVEMTETDGTFCIELLRQLHDAGARFSEVPVSHYPRVYGQSMYYNPRSVLGSYVALAKLWLRLVGRRGAEPQPVRSSAD